MHGITLQSPAKQLSQQPANNSPTMTRQLLRNRILAALSPEDIELLRPVDVEFPRGHVIFDRGGRVDRLYLPHTALVSLVTHLRDGGTIETGTVGSEGILGAFAIDGDDIVIDDAQRGGG